MTRKLKNPLAPYMKDPVFIRAIRNALKLDEDGMNSSTAWVEVDKMMAQLPRRPR